MSKKIYYKYNPESLNYERIYPSVKNRILTILRHLVSGILIGFGVFWGAANLLDSPLEKELKKENQMIITQYKILSKRLDETLLVLNDVKQRDDNLYRAIFHTEPIASSIRNSGIGSPDKYDYLMKIPNSELIIQSSKKMDLIAKQIYVQSNSFDYIVSLAKSQKDRLQHIPSIQPVADKSLKRVASGYGMRIDPIYGTPRFHAGMDFTAPTGTPIYATGNGTVIWADWKQGYGKCIIIDHGYNFKTLYAHMDEYVARAGQKVNRGEQIGKVGNTGKSTGPHLHYEVHVKGQADNPAKYYFMDLTPEEYDQMLQIAANHGQVMD